MKVTTSKDYTLFHTLHMNRDINPKHVETMKASILKMGVIRPVVICETSTIDGQNKKFIVDGQHLFQALQALKMPIPYVSISVTNEIELVNKMALLNSSSKSWELVNYVNAYKAYIPDYMKLFKFQNMYNMEMKVIASVCDLDMSYTRDLRSDKEPGRLIKSGKFKINNPTAEKALKDLSELFIALSTVGSVSWYAKRVMAKVFMAAIKSGYNHSLAMTNIKKHHKQLSLMTKDADMADFFARKVFEIKLN